jgi:hypothetical protein
MPKAPESSARRMRALTQMSVELRIVREDASPLTG